jgi:hypothetical protein
MNHAILKALKRKGFSSKMSGHIKLTFRYSGRDTSIRTWVSHGKKEISDRLIGIMAEQLSLSRQQFENLVDCSLGERELIALYEEKGIL